MYLILPQKSCTPTLLTPRNINRQITPEPKRRKVIGLASTNIRRKESSLNSNQPRLAHIVLLFSEISVGLKKRYKHGIQSGCPRQKTNSRECYLLPMQTCEHDPLDCQDILFHVSVNGFTKTRELSSSEKPVSIALLQHLSSHVEGPLSQQPLRTKDCDEIVWDSFRLFFGVRQDVVLAGSGQQQIQ